MSKCLVATSEEFRSKGLRTSGSEFLITAELSSAETILNVSHVASEPRWRAWPELLKTRMVTGKVSPGKNCSWSSLISTLTTSAGPRKTANKTTATMENRYFIWLETL